MSRRRRSAALRAVDFMRHTQEKSHRGRAELIKWLEGGREYLGSIGYGPFLRKEDPYDLAKLAPISLETVSAAADAETKAAVATENQRHTALEFAPGVHT